jgi:hypothetical protein
LEILALKLRAAIELYQLRWKLPSQKDAYDLRQDFLTEDDWADLTRWQKILVPFRELCVQEEGRAQKLGQEGQYGTLWRVLHGMNFMSNVLEKAQAEVNEPQVDLEQTEHFNTGINTAWLKLEKYFKLVNRYTAAIALHPAWRLEYFEDKWADHPNSIKAAKKTFKNLFLKYSGKNPSDGTSVRRAKLDLSRVRWILGRLSIAEISETEAERYGELGAGQLCKVLRPPARRNPCPAGLVERTPTRISHTRTHGF